MSSEAYNGSIAKCLKCPDRGSAELCDEPGLTIETLPVIEGWYRFSSQSDELYKCWKDNCLGSTGPKGADLTDVDNQCRDHATGPLCSQCEPNFYSSDGRCVECELMEWQDYLITFGPIVGIVLLLVLTVAVWWCLSTAQAKNQPQFVKDANGYAATHREKFLTWYRSNKEDIALKMDQVSIILVSQPPLVLTLVPSPTFT